MYLSNVAFSWSSDNFEEKIGASEGSGGKAPPDFAREVSYQMHQGLLVVTLS